MALSAQPAGVAQRVTTEIFAMALKGAGVGAALGLASARYVETRFYEVWVRGPRNAGPAATVVFTATVFASAWPAVLRAVRIDPAKVLKTE